MILTREELVGREAEGLMGAGRSRWSEKASRHADSDSV